MAKMTDAAKAAANKKDERAPEQIAAEKEVKRAARAAKFKELGGKRMTVALAKIALLGNLASKAQYDYSPEQVAKMVKALENAVEQVAGKFTSSGKVQSGGFEF